MNTKNDFKAFSISNGANVVNQISYENSPELQTGFPPNDITTHVLNKTLRQSSAISSVVADFIATGSGSDVLDDGNIAKLTAQLNKALEKKITTHTTQVPDASLTQKGVVQLTNMVGNSHTLAATQKLVSDINNNVNNRINQLPNMSSFTANLTQNGWQKLPSGLIIMWGIALVSFGGSGKPNSGYLNNFPIPFPNKCFSITLTHNGWDPGSAGIFGIKIENQNQFRCYRSNTPYTPSVGTFFIAIGY
ncbi:Phage tail fiber repeat protein [Photorhabdus australis subsp. thailandensis]|uniref:Phage tail fiber repeat protein n=1 Tax=Photorhabdus australis subsp. thailandensis TaxID=2805096 RepID=A0A1C0U189_9GAMM|nr:phage tail protein [Photorhabdus australis]OCQ51689.1 Phage tail fiber repeat protein [Photorhabdus australis subsp. thailandensis]